MKRFLVLAFLVASFCLSAQAAVYAVPQTYDNIVNGQKSSTYSVINNNTSVLSSNSYTIGGVSVKYRCIVVPKITCRSSSVDPIIVATTSEVNAQDPVSNENLQIYNSDIRIEADNPGTGTGNFYVCGAVYAGISFDDFSIGTDAATSSITYSYKGNALLRSFVYFSDLAASTNPTNKSGTGSAGSYMTIEHHQYCK